MKLKHLKNKLIKLKCKDFDINKIPEGYCCTSCPYKNILKLALKSLLIINYKMVKTGQVF